MTTRYRLTMNLADSTYETWEGIAKRQGKGMGEALRDFLAVYKYLYDAQSNGERLLVEHKRGKIQELRLL